MGPSSNPHTSPSEERQRGLIAWFAHNPVAANLLMLVLIVGGVYSALTLPKTMFPDVDSNYIDILKAYPGAAPKEVETGLVMRIEEAIEDIEGIKDISATAKEGLADVSVEVLQDFAVETVLEDIKQAIDGVSSFPEGAETATIAKSKRKSRVISVQLYGDLDERTLKHLAEQTREELLSLPAVSSADVFGTRPYEVSIEVSETALQAYQLTLSDVTRAIRAASIELPGGTVKSASGELLLRVSNQALVGDDFAKIVLIRTEDGSQVLLEDVATVRDGFEEMQLLARFNGKPSVGMLIFALGDQSEIEVAQAVRDYVAEKQQQLPEGVSIAYWGDRSFYLTGRLELMLDNMKIGAILVLLILALFLELRLAFWVVIGIPVSFFGALLIMPMVDVSINVISLFGFILVLGLVVDDAIIIGESAYTEIETRGHSLANVVRGAQRVAVPATFGVLTTVAAFAPMLLSSDPQSAFVKNIAWVVILCLLFSLVESKMILPAHLVHTRIQKTPGHNPLDRARFWVDSHLKAFIHGHYTRVLHSALINRYATLAMFLALWFLATSLVASGMIRTVLFPKIASDFIEVSLEMEEGNASLQTVRVLSGIEEAMLKADADIQKTLGESVIQNMYTFSTSETTGRTLVELTKSEDRSLSTFDISARWRAQLTEQPGVKSISFNDAIGHQGKDLSFLFKSKDLNQLQQLVVELNAQLASYDGVYDLENSLSGGKPELKVELKPEAHLQGVDLQRLATQVRQGFYGDEVQRFIREGEEVKVMVRYPEDARTEPGFLEQMRVRTAEGTAIPFSALASAHEQSGVGKIDRVNGFRAARVYAEVDKAIVVPERVQQEIETYLQQELLPKFPEVSYERTGQAKNRAQTERETLMSFLAALIGIYALLAIPLKSYVQPLIVMSAIPFGIIGAIIGHALLGLDLSRLSLFGIIALTGVVVNDSLILVTLINEQRREGIAITQAVLEAGKRRFRAILLTSLTTFVGLVPILSETSLQAQIVIPMATSLAFGIVFATLISLILVPALYVILADSRVLRGRFKEEWQSLKQRF